jgi:hypothetical protein
MINRTPDYERLRDVCEGYGLLTPQELIALIPEIANEESIQCVIARSVIAKRFKVEEETNKRAGHVIPLMRPKRPVVRE